MLHNLRTWRHGAGSVILIALLTAWFSVPMQACLTMANSGISQHHAQDPDPDHDPAVTGRADAVIGHPCSKAICSVLEGITDQLSKQPAPADVIEALFLAVLFWILPAVLALGPLRHLRPFATPHLKLPPPLRFRVLLI